MLTFALLFVRVHGCVCVCVSSTGWKLNPVVGAVYGPEFYAGKESVL